LGEVAGGGDGQAGKGGVVVEQFNGLRGGLEPEDEVKRAGGKGGAVAGGGEGFAGLSELDLEAEQVGFQELAGVVAGAGDGDGGFVGADAGLDCADGFAGLAEIEGGADDLGDEALLGGAEVESGGLGAGLGGGAARRGATTGVEIVGDGAGSVEVVDATGTIEIETEVEGALVEDGAEGQHRAVGVGVAAGEGNLRAPRRLGLIDERLGGVDPGLGDAGVGMPLQGGGDGPVQSPRLGAEGSRGENQDGERG
jgi:hypothetical protein